MSADPTTVEKTTRLKKEIESALIKRNLPASRNLINELISCQESHGDYFYLSRIIKKNEFESESNELPIAVISSIAIKNIESFFYVKAFMNNYRVKTYFNPFGMLEQVVIDGESDFYTFCPEYVILFIRVSDLYPDVYHFRGDRSIEKLEDAFKKVLRSIETMVQKITAYSKSQVHILVHNFEYPKMSIREVSLCPFSSKVKKIIDDANAQLSELCSLNSNLYYFNYNYFLYLNGYKQVNDEAQFLLSQNPIMSQFLPPLVDEYIRYIKSTKGRCYKCLAVDADNVLWGGIVGEDGLEKLQLGGDYLGNVYKEFQKTLLDYYHKGMIIILLSKNNEEDIEEVFAGHPEMILKKEHFTMIKANWRDKADNLLECVRELNIGLDSVVFLDDSPFEREQMRLRLPEVLTIELPNRPEAYKAALSAAHIYEKNSLSEEDINRNAMYRNELERKEIQKQYHSLEEYFFGLEMRATIKIPEKVNLMRLEGLLRRTNQFNFTTHRYSASHLEKILADPGYSFYYISLSDRIGDSGICGLIIVEKDNERRTWSIDTFAISCRVLGRSLEDVFLSFVIERAVEEGCREISGRFIPTKKNKQCESYYSRFNFEPGPAAKDGSVLWRTDTGKVTLKKHPWIEVIAG